MRTPMVTRTCKTTNVTVLGMDIETAEPMHKTATLSRTYKSNEQVLKAVKPLLETDTFKVVTVINVEVNEKLYGMTEAEFIAAAKILPERK